MARKAFYSFHYKPDNWRASEVRNMGVVDGNRPASDNDWETITSGGDAKIRKWIEDQMYGKSVAIVLIGTNTAGRKWINYEIEKAWNENMGVLGIYIHNLKDRGGAQASQGKNPFGGFKIGSRDLAGIVKAYNPPYSTSTNVYSHIKENLASWIEKAIEIRNDYD